MLRLFIAGVFAVFIAFPVQAAGNHDDQGRGDQGSWPELRAELFDKREISDARGIVTLTTPYRSSDDRRVPIRADVVLPDGEEIKRLILMIDENPVPVSAEFNMEQSIEVFSADITMRINGPSMVRAIVETSEGRLLMDAAKVKTSGTGACAAPPITGVEEALVTLGNMDLYSGKPNQPRLSISHPQHSGMQMDQISLLFILAHYVDEVESWTDDAPLFKMTGSISLSENPDISFSVPDGVSELRVRMTDTDELVFEKRFPLNGA